MAFSKEASNPNPCVVVLSFQQALRDLLHVTIVSFEITLFRPFDIMVYFSAFLFIVSSTQAASAFNFPAGRAVRSKSLVQRKTTSETQYALISSPSKLRMAADDDRPLTKPMLDRVKYPSDLKGMNIRDLKQVKRVHVLFLLLCLFCSTFDPLTCFMETCLYDEAGARASMGSY